MHHRHYHSPWKRGIYSMGLIIFLMAFGTVGMHLTEGMPYMDAFYFMSMIATAQGSAITPGSVAGKIFASAMAFLSVGLLVAALGFVFGPFFGKLWHLGEIKLEEELRLIAHRNDKDHLKR